MIPRAFIDDLVARSDIVEIIDGYVPLRKAGKNYVACCPFHEEKTPSFNVQPDKQFYHCFGCGESGNVLSFLINYSRIEFVDAVEELAARYGLQVPHENTSTNQVKLTGAQRESLYPILEQAAAYYRSQLQQPHAAPAREYLIQRGLGEEIIAEFGIGFAPSGWRNILDALGGASPAKQRVLNEAGMLASNEDGQVYDRFRARIMFPIYDLRGRVIAFGGRVLDDSKPKYLNSPETPIFHKSRELYALHLVRKARPTEVVVVEGYMDVVALAQHGVRNAVATLGTSLSLDHLKQLFRGAARVVFCFDGDDAGRKAAWRALETALPQLSAGREVGFMFLPGGEDPDSLVRNEGRVGFEQRLAQAVGVSDYLFDALRSQVDINKVEGRSRFIELAKPLISTMPSGAARDLMSERLSDIDPRNTSRLLTSPDQHRAAQANHFQRITRQRSAQALPAPAQFSPLRSVLGLLVQQPQLATRIGQSVRDTLAAVEMSGIDLLIAILDFIDAHGVEQVHSGVILENWRDTEHEAALRKFVNWQHGLPETGIEAEFDDALRRLNSLYGEQRLDTLLAKSTMVGLDNHEKQELNQLLLARH